MKKYAHKTMMLLLLLFIGTSFAHNQKSAEHFSSNDLQSNPESKIHSRQPVVKIALLLDTSNSMDGLINQAKSQLWDIVNQFAYAKCGNNSRPGLQIALYQYGNNDLASQEGYVQQVLGFSSDLDEISAKLFSLTTNGGEEYCGQVIHQSLRQLDWGKNPDDLKMIFIAGNEPFTQGKKDFRESVINAKEKDVIVNTIFCGDYRQGIKTHWQEGALLGGGEYMAIDHNRQVVHIKTPYDEIIIRLNARLNNTYVSYGAMGVSRMAIQEEQDSEAMELQEAVAVKRAVSKSSEIYNNAEWDLVDASSRKDFDLAKIKKETLPASLRGKSEGQIQEFLAEKKAERQRVQKEIQQANAKREEYLAKQEKNETGELEQAMLKAIKKQAAQKNLYWE
ncbi:vWA domain-containing protein [uncultured Muriicola sp.]|uniref:vWA domain-containing protein n=1 Tax=uncultured Muriicola sp. TaxID=1583102 RepID=UPI0026252FCF|nr:vWA domain-containing protein [uncultured Muriicola sp.]